MEFVRIVNTNYEWILFRRNLSWVAKRYLSFGLFRRNQSCSRFEDHGFSKQKHNLLFFLIFNTIGKISILEYQHDWPLQGRIHGGGFLSTHDTPLQGENTTGNFNFIITAVFPPLSNSTLTLIPPPDRRSIGTFDEGVQLENRF